MDYTYIYYELEKIKTQISKLIIEKNEHWYTLIGFIYDLLKLGYSEEFLLNKSPIELLLINSKTHEIETHLVEMMRAQQN